MSSNLPLKTCELTSNVRVRFLKLNYFSSKDFVVDRFFKPKGKCIEKSSFIREPRRGKKQVFLYLLTKFFGKSNNQHFSLSVGQALCILVLVFTIMLNNISLLRMTFKTRLKSHI